MGKLFEYLNGPADDLETQQMKRDLVAQDKLITELQRENDRLKKEIEELRDRLKPIPPHL